MYHDFAECYREYKLATPTLKIHTEIPLLPNPVPDFLSSLLKKDEFLWDDWYTERKIPWLLIYNNDKLYLKYFETFMNNSYRRIYYKYKELPTKNTEWSDEANYGWYTEYDEHALDNFLETYSKIINKNEYPILYSFMTGVHNRRYSDQLMAICLMKTNKFFCHMMWREYPPYVDFVRNVISNRRVRTVMIHDRCNENFATCDAEYVFADDYIVFNILKFL